MMVRVVACPRNKRYQCVIGADGARTTVISDTLHEYELFNIYGDSRSEKHKSEQRRMLLPYLTTAVPQLVMGDLNCALEAHYRFYPDDATFDQKRGVKKRDVQEWLTLWRPADMEELPHDGVMTLSHKSPPMLSRNDRAYSNGGSVERAADTWGVKALTTSFAATLSDRVPIVVKWQPEEKPKGEALCRFPDWVSEEPGFEGGWCLSHTGGGVSPTLGVVSPGPRPCYARTPLLSLKRLSRRRFPNGLEAQRGGGSSSA